MISEREETEHVSSSGNAMTMSHRIFYFQFGASALHYLSPINSSYHHLFTTDPSTPHFFTLSGQPPFPPQHCPSLWQPPHSAFGYHHQRSVHGSGEHPRFLPLP